MSEDFDTVAYWHGEPLADMPREKLIEIITELARDVERLRHENTTVRVRWINDLADARRQSRRHPQ